MAKRVGILYHPRLEFARKLAAELQDILLQHGATPWLVSAWNEAEARASMAGTDFVVTLGGDGTILRAARAVVPRAIPILGINLGRLGFMAELTAAQVREKLPAFLKGEGWVEERAMLQAEVLNGGKGKGEVYHALNDVVVGRGGNPRLIHLTVMLEGEVFTTYRADGVIVATATGSTGYALSAGGPILHPQAREMILQPIAPHFSLPNGLVLPPTGVVEMEVGGEQQALVSLDGQVDVPLSGGARVRVNRSPYLARFLRVQSATYFYRLLGPRLSGQFGL